MNDDFCACWEHREESGTFPRPIAAPESPRTRAREARRRRSGARTLARSRARTPSRFKRASARSDARRARHARAHRNPDGISDNPPEGGSKKTGRRVDGRVARGARARRKRTWTWQPWRSARPWSARRRRGDASAIVNASGGVVRARVASRDFLRLNLASERKKRAGFPGDARRVERRDALGGRGHLVHREGGRASDGHGHFDCAFERR